MNNNIFLSTLLGKPNTPPPMWMMRQAGRYLPEYLELRKNASNFMKFCYTPKLAVEATLQPIQRFPLDAAIIFSDILVIPDALGVGVRFEKNVGPILDPVTPDNVTSLSAKPDQLQPVYEAIHTVRSKLDKDKALIGFSGAAWTLAAYMVQGKSSRDFVEARLQLNHDKAFAKSLLEALVEHISSHLIAQVKAGADALQLFDSWAGCLNPYEFDDWVIKPTKSIVSIVKKEFPDTPIIGFPRLAGLRYPDYVQQTGVDAISIDQFMSLAWIVKHCSDTVVQGNLDPVILIEGGDRLHQAVIEILDATKDTPFIFNLGHGIMPQTPIAHVEQLCKLVKG